MQGRSGVTANTAKRLVLDAGQLYQNIAIAALENAVFNLTNVLTGATLIGATKGGSSFNPSRPMRDIEADGLLGPTKEFVRRGKGQEFTLEASILELTSANLTKIMAGATVAAAGTMQKISGGPILTAGYMSNIAWLGTYSDATVTAPIFIVLYNVLPVEVSDISFEDDNETAVKVTFRAHADPANPLVEPWNIYHPQA
jgi:hypothetical protein